MSSKLVLPQCQENPTHLNHPPPPEKPLRIQICGDLEYLDKLFQNGNKIARPETSAALPAHFDEPCLELVQMAFKLLYGREPDTEVPRDIVPRHQYHLWRYRIGDRILPEPILETYTITFDHLVEPHNEDDPETLMLNVIDPSDPATASHVKFDTGVYTAGTESVVLLVPRCCQVRKGTTDRLRINREIEELKMSFDDKLKRYEEENRAHEEKQARKRARLGVV